MMQYVIWSLFRITFLQINKELNIGSILQFAMSRSRKRHHLNVDVRKRGYVFAKCTLCGSLKDLISKLRRNINDVKKYELKLKKHLLHQELCRSLYHTWRSEFVWSKDKFLCVIHDKMDHGKTAFLRLQVANKMICGLRQLPITLTSMIAHGHGDERYAQYFNELWPNDPNFTISSKNLQQWTLLPLWFGRLLKVIHILPCFVTCVSYRMTSWVHTAWQWSRVQYLLTTSCLSRNCWGNSLLSQHKEWIFDKPLSAILFFVGWSLNYFTFFVFQQYWHTRWIQHHTLGIPLVPSIPLEKDLGGLWRTMEQDAVSDLMYSASVSVALDLLWMLWPLELKITYHEDCTMGAA